MAGKLRYFSQRVPLRDPIGTSNQYAHTGIRDALIYSQGNAWPPRGRRDSGGPFLVQHRLLTSQPSNWLTLTLGSGQPTKWRFIPSGGPHGSAITYGAIPDFDTENSALFSQGATGYRRARPGNPVANAGQWLVELRDLPRLPLLLYNRLNWYRSLGSEYLNVEFGWKPFVRDLIKMYETYRQIDRLLAQIVAQNGKGQRRRRTISDTTTTTSVTTSYPSGASGFAAFWPSPTTYGGFSAASTRVVTTTIKEKVWFSAKFRYWIPDTGSSQWRRSATLALFGLNPTPSLLWEVLPWTWLIGYFSNFGDVVSNMSSNAVSNLTADYAYVMREKITTVERVSTGTILPTSGYYRYSGGDFVAQSADTTIQRGRARGSPYGFGSTWGSLSGYQQSILAALGISRARF